MPIELNEYLSNSWAQKTNEADQIKTILLAAGLGSRMAPLTTSHAPKPMFPLAGCVPILESWVRDSIDSGITDISMNLCVLSNAIRDYFKKGEKYGATINYVDEDTPSGTLGGVCKQALGSAVKRVSPTETMPVTKPFGGSTVFVISGDIVSDIGAPQLQQLYEIHKQKGAAFTMVLTPVPWETRGEFGTVELEEPEKLDGLFSKSGRIKAFREKDPDSPSNLNNASIYIIEMDLIKALDPFRTEAKLGVDNPFYDFGKHVFPAMLKKLSYVDLPGEWILWGVEYDGGWFDVGRKRDYLDVNEGALRGELNLEIPYEKLPWGYLGMNCDVDFSKVTIVPPVAIGNNCTIEAGSVIGPYAVIGDGWTIGENTQISHSTLWPRYDFYTGKNEKINPEEWAKRDRHMVEKETVIRNSIVVGGTVSGTMESKTVDVEENGDIKEYDIDWVPDKKRV